MKMLRYWHLPLFALALLLLVTLAVADNYRNPADENWRRHQLHCAPDVILKAVDAAAVIMPEILHPVWQDKSAR